MKNVKGGLAGGEDYGYFASGAGACRYLDPAAGIMPA